jgi:hypothetical protein
MPSVEATRLELVTLESRLKLPMKNAPSPPLSPT